MGDDLLLVLCGSVGFAFPWVLEFVPIHQQLHVVFRQLLRLRVPWVEDEVALRGGVLDVGEF